MKFCHFYFSNIQRLDILVNKELPVRRREARLKVDQLKQDRIMLQVLLLSIVFSTEYYQLFFGLPTECNLCCTTKENSEGARSCC